MAPASVTDEDGIADLTAFHAAQHGEEGPAFQCHRPAEGHVVLSQPRPYDGRDDGLVPRLAQPSRRLQRHRPAEQDVGAGAQVRPVLLERGDGDDRQRVPPGRILHL